MKSRLLILVLALGAAFPFAGCDTIGEPLTERFNRPMVAQTFEASAAKVFEAAGASLRAMGYTVRTAKGSSGVIEAYGRLGIDDSFRASNQHNCRVTIAATPDGAAEVQIEVREQVEERTGAGIMRQSEQVLPRGGVHERFFAEVQARL